MGFYGANVGQLLGRLPLVHLLYEMLSLLVASKAFDFLCEGLRNHQKPL